MEMIKLTCLLLFWTAFAKADASTYVASDNCTDRANTSVLAAIELILYPSTSTDDNVTVLVANALDLLPSMDLSKPTILYIFGWTETCSSTSVAAILDVLCEAETMNVILVNWEKIAGDVYYYSAASVNGVGYTVAMALNELVASGVDSSSLRVVGHSLGAQISGYIGRNVNFTLPRITGLDPAGPNFTETEPHLSSTDAEFVEIIHTNAGCAGIAYSAGHVDFWLNLGSVQPGCESDTYVVECACSHARSWRYYIEAFADSKAYVGLACESTTEFEAGTCSGKTTVLMGYATPSTARGDFDLQTNSATPFGRGLNGTIYYTSL